MGQEVGRAEAKECHTAAAAAWSREGGAEGRLASTVTSWAASSDEQKMQVEWERKKKALRDPQDGCYCCCQFLQIHEV